MKYSNAWVFGLLVGCRAYVMEPSITGVEPDYIHTLEPVQITLKGEGLYPVSTPHAGSGGPALNDQFSASLIPVDGDGPTVRLEQVRWVKSGELSAVVGSGIEPGEYNISVTAPNSLWSIGPAVLEIASSEIGQIGLDFDQDYYTVGEEALVEVKVQDRQGADLAVDAEVYLQFTNLEGTPVKVDVEQFENITLEGWSEDNWLKGKVGESGIGSFTMTTEVAMDLEVRASPFAPGGNEPDEYEVIKFRPTDGLRVGFSFPDMRGPVVAGEPVKVRIDLRDKFHNPVLVKENVTLFTNCNDSILNVNIPTTVQYGLSFKQANGTRCDDPTTTLYAKLLNGEPLVGLSEPFVVVPAAASKLSVVGQLEIRAGEDSSINLIEVDAYSNPIQVLDNDKVRDFVLVPDGSVVDHTCEDSCSVRLYDIEHSNQRIRATSTDGLTGTTAALNIIPGRAAEVELVGGQTERTAGTPFVFTVRVMDAYGHAFDASLLQSDKWQAWASGPSGDVPCDSVVDAPDGTVEIACSPTVAGGHVFFLSHSEGEAEPFFFAQAEVLPGPREVVEVIAAQLQVDMGDRLALQVTAFDQYGNETEFETGVEHTLTDSAGLFDVVTLDVSTIEGNVFEVQMVPVAEGLTRIQFKADNVVEAVSELITVQ